MKRVVTMRIKRFPSENWAGDPTPGRDWYELYGSPKSKTPLTDFCKRGWERITGIKLQPGVSQQIKITIESVPVRKSAKKKA